MGTKKTGHLTYNDLSNYRWDRTGVGDSLNKKLLNLETRYNISLNQIESNKKLLESNPNDEKISKRIQDLIEESKKLKLERDSALKEYREYNNIKRNRVNRYNDLLKKVRDKGYGYKDKGRNIGGIAGAGIGIATGTAVGLKLAKRKAKKLGLKPGTKEYKKFIRKRMAVGGVTGGTLGSIAGIQIGKSVGNYLGNKYAHGYGWKNQEKYLKNKNNNNTI